MPRSHVASGDLIPMPDAELDQVATRLRQLVRDVPDFPEPGILFRDLTGVFGHPEGLRDMVAGILALAPEGVDLVAGMEARGFIVGAAVAAALGVGFVPVRKAGKLPPPVDTLHYELEYGQASLEIRHGTVGPGTRVLVVDDILATGGTACAAGELLRRAGGIVVGYAFVIELAGLGGRSALMSRGHDAAVQSVVVLPA